MLDVVRLHEELEALGPLAPAAFVAITVIASCIPVAPMSAINLAAGSFFGIRLGTLLFVLSASVGAVVPALVVRGSLRPCIIRRMQKYEDQWQAINGALQKEGPITMVALLRLSPGLPVSLASYMLGLTDVSLAALFLGTALGLAPFSFVYCYLAELGEEVAEGKGGQNNMQVVMTVVGLLFTIVLMLKIGKIAQSALDSAARQRMGADASTGADDLERLDAEVDLDVPTDQGNDKVALLGS